MLTVEQIVAAQKAQVANLMGLSQKALESAEKLAELNFQASKSALSDSANQVQALLGVKDVQELVALQQSVMQPMAEKAAAYSRHLYEIASGMGAEVSKVAEGQAAEAQKGFVTAVESAMKNAPQGSESAVAMVKNAINSSTAALESVQKAVKQATDLAESNFNAVAQTAVNAASAPKAKAKA